MCFCHAFQQPDRAVPTSAETKCRDEVLVGKHTEVARTSIVLQLSGTIFQSTLELLRDIKVINKACTGPAGKKLHSVSVLHREVL